MLLNSSVHQSDSVIHIYIYGLPWWLNGKESAFNAGDVGSILGWGRSLGEGNDNPLQYSFLGDPMNCGASWVTVNRVTKSQT